MKWFDRIPIWMFVVIAVLGGLAPYFPEPHLWEKLKKLGAGTLTHPLELFDLFYHGLPVLILALKMFRNRFLRNQAMQQHP